jgi:hypothetical protein
MTNTGGFFRCWQGIARRSRCRDCRKPMVWRTTDQNKQLPFQPEAKPVRVDVHPEKGTRFDVLPASALHARVCPSRKAAPTRRRTPRPQQERLL